MPLLKKPWNINRRQQQKKRKSFELKKNTEKLFSTEVGDPNNSETSKIQSRQTKRKKQNKKDKKDDIDDEKRVFCVLPQTLLKQSSKRISLTL